MNVKGPYAPVDGRGPLPEETVCGAVPPVTSTPSKTELEGMLELPVTLTVPESVAVDTVGAVKGSGLVTATAPRLVIRSDEKNVVKESMD